MTARTFKHSDRMEIDVATKLATDLYEFFRYESLEDVALMLKMARTGQLGTGYGRLDSDTLFSVFVPKYLDIKAEEREREHKRNKHNFSKVQMSDESYKKFDELSQKLKSNSKAKEEITVPVVNHHQIYINKLKAGIPRLTDKQLDDNLKNLLASDQEVFADAIQLFKDEIQKRQNPWM